MGTRARFAAGCVASTLVLANAMVACGARTGLPFESDETFVIFDAEPDVDQGTPDQLVPDQFVADQFVPDRAVADRFVPDAPQKDAPEELPGIDVNRPDVPVFNPCPDAAATLIYVIGNSNTLYSYDPPTATFTTIGTISCPDAGESQPFSMAVDREGIAYVEFALSVQTPTTSKEIGENLYRVSTKTASCTPTTYDPVANGQVTFGMGFVANAGNGGDGGETLFIAQQPNAQNADNVLATIDTTTFAVNVVGAFAPGVKNAELTGTGDGRLFVFYDDNPVYNNNPDGGSNVPPSLIGQVDPATALLTGQDTLNLAQGNGWAFGFWGGDFYTFTAPGDQTVVTRFNPADQSLVQQASIADTIVGAGVSTCAPSQ